ncbi:sialidase family protein [Microlunatus soli]|uniref:BNR repeat-like domain-containing protein n=1 Tax=Microlunatus soli TaxID=630515 RepID=A0A1H1YL06_9ACTN|nr:sialidase family protein [Microlunatus soli]SDT22228.1 BNR repeat-like domain-containing protein [Microlunatus soli]
MRSRIRTFAALIAAALVVVTLHMTDSVASSPTQTWDFESDAVGELPAGCRPTDSAQPGRVTDAIAYRGQQALDLTDRSPEAQTAVACRSDVSSGIDLRMAVRPESLTDGVTVSLLGSFLDIDQVDTPVFKIWIKPDGSVFWFDGLAQDALGWTQIGRAHTMPTGTWSTLAIQVPTNLTTAFIHASTDAEASVPGARFDNSTYVGAAGPVGISPVATISGFQIGTGQTVTGVDRVQIDDVHVGTGSGLTPPAPDPTFVIGQRTVIDATSDGLVQMPNSSTTRRLPGGGQEALVTYPVHGDATHDTGTAMASSIDGGHTWSDVSERNPFPDEQSFYLTALRNGDLLAVNYHTFMTAGTDNHQAAVPTAISTDGGRTWIHREGQMTAPQRMRPISTATSRPGFPLGGFVLVHSVLEDANGTLYQSGYGYYATDKHYRSIVMTSTDRGENWQVRSTIAVNDQLSSHPRFEGFGEPALAFAADGSLVAVMRTGNYQPLYQSRSANAGYAWTTPTVVTASDGIPVTGVFPDLKLMGNGTLVLWAGRPGQFLLASRDGTGRSWSPTRMVDYRNSGNGTLTPVGRNRLVVFGDRGADWTPNTNRRKEIWSRPVVVAGRG